ncbi:MAG: hypothetical protein LBH10_06835 [Burkholderiaceae bacterium]|jgi:hypothetical protein|nr:hypothetical protein [Burkholderiaceae bacterium]
MQKKSYLTALAVCAAMTLSGCGGGGGDDNAANGTSTSASGNPPPTSDGSSTSNNASASRSAIEGMWTGGWPSLSTQSNGWSNYSTQLIILDNGSLFGTYGTLGSDQIYHINGMLYGSGSVTNDGASTSLTVPVSGLFTQFDMSGSALPNVNHSFSGSAWSQFSLDITLDEGTLLPLSYADSYDQAAQLSSVAGNYSSLSAISGQNSFIQNNIIISGSTLTLPSDANGCSANGTLTPHQTSHGVVGVFDANLTFNGTGCLLGDGTTIQGVAFQSYDNQALEILMVTPDSQTGYMLMGSRQ